MLTRRSFLSALSAAAAAALIPVRKLVWTPLRQFRVTGPDIVVKAGEVVLLNGGEHGWVEVHGHLVIRGATIQRLDARGHCTVCSEGSGGMIRELNLYDNACVGLPASSCTFATDLTNLDGWSNILPPRSGDFITIG